MNTTRKAVELTKYIFSVPEWHEILVRIILLSYLFGFLTYLAQGKNLLECFLIGGASGFFLFGVPAIIAGITGFSLVKRGERKARLRRMLYLAYFSMCLYSLVYVALTYASKMFEINVANVALLINACLLALWLLVQKAVYGVKIPKSFVISLVQPFFNVVFLSIAYSLELIERVEWIAPLILVSRLIVASFVFLIMLLAFFFIIDAPMKRNFGVSSLQVFSLFLAQWIDRSGELEEIFEEIGDDVYTQLTVIGLKGKRKKVALVVPCVHFGPFGDLGGSKLFNMIANRLRRMGWATMVFHAPVTHDFNPVSRREAEKVSEEIAKMVSNLRFDGGVSEQVTVKKENISLTIQSFSGLKVLFFSNELGDEDIEFGVGRAVENACSEPCVMVDTHSRMKFKRAVLSGSKDAMIMEELAREASRIKLKEERARMGFSEILWEGPEIKGLGREGVKALIIELEGKRFAFLLFDANNMLPELRAKMEGLLEAMGFTSWVVATSDSHSVNMVSGAYNPLGSRMEWEKLLQMAKKALERASEKLEDVKVGWARKVIRVKVFGPRSSDELIGTINSVVAVSKLLAPMFVALSIVLGGLALWLVGA